MTRSASRIEIPPPWPSLRDDLEARLKAMTVSHKPDHGVAAQLHEDTAYGAVKEPEKEGGNLVYRKDFPVAERKGNRADSRPAAARPRQGACRD